MNLVIGSGADYIGFNNLDINNKIDVASSGTLAVTGVFSKSGSQGLYSGTGDIYTGGFAGDAESTIDTGDGDSSFPIDQLSNDGFEDIEDFITSGGSSPLPDELLFFAATSDEHGILLQWSTVSELNNNFFTLERSRNGKDFEIVTIVESNGTSHIQIDYNYTDSNPYLGLSYYRLS